MKTIKVFITMTCHQVWLFFKDKLLELQLQLLSGFSVKVIFAGIFKFQHFFNSLLKTHPISIVIINASNSTSIYFMYLMPFNNLIIIQQKLRIINDTFENIKSIIYQQKKNHGNILQ